MHSHVPALVLLLAVSAARPEPADPDVLVTKIEVRDGGRLGLIAPTAGRGISIYVEVQNRSGETAPDMNLICRRLMSAGGPTQAEATVRTGSVAANTTRTFTLAMTPAPSAGPSNMWCMVDGGNFVREADETNNTRALDFVIFADLANDFRVEIRNLKPWSAATSNYSASFEVFNPGRGPEPPPAGVPQRLRWQAVCQLPQMPWVWIRAGPINMSQYAGGDLPAPGQTVAGQFGLSGLDLSGKPPASSMPAMLNLNCEITVGAFMPNVPVAHINPSQITSDWGMPIVWWKQAVTLSLPNPEAK